MDVAPSHRGLLQAAGLLSLRWDFWSSWFGSKQHMHRSIGDTRRVTCKMLSSEEMAFLGACSLGGWASCRDLDQSTGVCDPCGPGASCHLSRAL